MDGWRERRKWTKREWWWETLRALLTDSSAEPPSSHLFITKAVTTVIFLSFLYVDAVCVCVCLCDNFHPVPLLGRTMERLICTISTPFKVQSAEKFSLREPAPADAHDVDGWT